MNKIKTRPFDMANYLTSEEDIAEYLRQVLEDGDPTELAVALGDIARTRKLTVQPITPPEEFRLYAGLLPWLNASQRP